MKYFPHLHGSELSAPLAPELHRDRQPRAVSPADFGQFNVVAPLDPRLPGGGGYTVGPIYNVNPDKFGVTDDYRTYSPAYGNVSQVYNGVDFSVNARLRNGLQVQAGTSTGQTVVDACEVRDKLPEQVSTGAASAGGIPQPGEPVLSHRARHHDAIHFRRIVYIVPKLDVQVAFTLTSSPGVPLQANWNIPNAVARQWLGRFGRRRAQHHCEPAGTRPDAKRPGQHPRLPDR